MAEPERLLWLAHRDVRQSRRVRGLRDAWQKAACRGTLQVSEVLRAVRVLSLKALPALLQAQPDESASLWVQQASQLDAPPQVQEPALWAPPEQPPQVLPAR